MWILGKRPVRISGLIRRGQQRVDLKQRVAPDIGRHHDLERQVAALVTADLTTVEPNRGNLARGAEPENHLVLRRW